MSKAKGTSVIGAVKTLRKNKERAREILPEGLHHYLTERIMTSGWYPEEDLVGLLRAIVEMSPASREETLRAMGAATAKSLGEGVYAHLVGKTGSSNTTFALWSSMHDSGTLKSWKDAESGDLYFELRDYGAPSPEMCAITGAFITEAMRMNGFVSTFVKDACVLSGDDCCRWKSS